jgi:hypothetical protein
VFYPYAIAAASQHFESLIKALASESIKKERNLMFYCFVSGKALGNYTVSVYTEKILTTMKQPRLPNN